MIGLLTTASFIHQGIIENVASVTVVVVALLVSAVVFTGGRWKWLWKDWITSLDPKRIGVMYLILSGVMLVRGFVDAALMRTQQGLSADFLSPDHYAQLFTAHGVIMIFFAAMPFMFGLINLMVPQQLGKKDVAFPLLNSISFWLTVAGAMLVNISLVVGQFAATGWLAYPPLSELAYSPGVGVDYYIWALQIAGIGTLLSAINFLATIIALRPKAMTLMKMPMFLWTTLGSMALVLFAFPVLTVTLALLALDRLVGAHFFTTDAGGSAMLYVNLIWAWGHPEVYILILPSFGIFSEIVATFSRKKLFGYTSMVVATLLIVILSFMVWVHHFFTMGAGADVNTFFGIMTMVIAIPTGVKVFNWLFTMFRGRITFETPMLWFMGFLTTFLIGGMTGVLMSIPGADYMLHNSLFLVAHFHNMLIGGVLFGFFAGFAYWAPKITGYMFDERLGKGAFWCWIVGFLLAFMPLYALGLMGTTRRLDYIDPSTPFHWLFGVAAVGVCVIALGGLFQVVQFVKAFRQKIPAPTNPWGGTSLEWQKDPVYLDETSAVGPVVGACIFILGFMIVWHIW